MKKIFHFSFCILLFSISNAKNLNTGIKIHPLLFTPVITSQPQDFYICISGTAVFSVTANVSGNSLLDGLTYQWYANNVLISGATSSSYSLNNVQAVNIGIPYKVIVSEYVLLNPLLTTPVSSNDAYLNKPIVSTITLPTTQSIVTGNNVTLSVNAGNNTGFKWYKDGVFITGATSSSYNINPLATKDNGTYVLHAATGCGADIVSTNSILHTDSILTSTAIGDFNSVSTWFNSAGTSNPLDFTRPEHIFKILSAKVFDTTKANFTIAGTLDIVNAATLITPSTTLNVGALIRSGTGSISADSTSKLSVNGTSSLYFTTGKQVLNTLTIAGGTTTLNTHLDIYGIAAIPGSVIANGTLNTGGNLTLKSTAISTSSIGNSTGTISGTVTIERYIPPRRAWRLMTAPITATGAPTLNAAWQEGATSSTSNINPGYGTHITGGLATAGFDRSPTNNSSLKYYNGTALVSVTGTLTGAITDRSAYFIFIRGDRSIIIGASTPSTTATISTLRVTGNINQGPQAIPIAANTTYPLVGNPFASTVDWATIAAASASTNIADRYYMWDPQIGGTNQVGGYVLVTNVAGSYVFVPATVTNVTPVLQSGQAVYVQLTSVGSAGTLTVNESAKLGAQSTVPFGRVATGNNFNKVSGAGKTASNLAINLQVVNADSSLSTVDGVLMTYNADNNNNFDINDAVKFGNINENFFIVSGKSTLTLESRKLPAVLDTIHLKVTNYKSAKYKFDLCLNDFTAVNLQPLLYDKYLKTTTVIDSAKHTNYSFNINKDSLSKAADRFSIVYRKLTAPVNFLNIKANVFKINSVAVDWKIKRELGILKYELLKADEADSFKVIATIPANNGTSVAAYSFNDLNLTTYNNNYRIKATDLNGVITYSAIVNVKLKKITGSISLWPNPIVGKTINLTIQNLIKGNHNYTISNNVGVTVYSGVINNSTGQMITAITLPKSFATGSYQMSIVNGESIIQSQFIISGK